jgi:hypothetical protein
MQSRNRNDLIRPQIPGQFRLSDLKRNGIIAERFFDTFLNIEKFQIHDTYQGLIRANQQLEREKKKQYELEKQKLLEIRQKFWTSEGNNSRQHVELLQPQQQLEQEEPFSVGTWCDYAEQEYDLLLLNEQCSNESIDSDWSLQQQQQQQNHTAVDSGDDDVESPNNNSSCTDEQDESDSSNSSNSSSNSIPTTPVMQHEHNHKQPSLQQQNWGMASY